MSEYFQPEPSLLLADKAATVRAIFEDQSWLELEFPASWRVKSQWLCDELNTYEKTIGFPYNATFQRWLEQREGWAPADESGSALSRLIYVAQEYRRSDAFRADGWRPFNTELIAEAFRRGVKIDLRCESLIGGASVKLLTVRVHAGRFYAFEGNSRKHAVSPGGQPARLAAPAAPAPRTVQPESKTLVLASD